VNKQLVASFDHVRDCQLLCAGALHASCGFLRAKVPAPAVENLTRRQRYPYEATPPVLLFIASQAY